MATSIKIQENTVTTTSISVTFIVNVTYAATYKIVYSITGNDGTDEQYTSSSFSLSAGGSTNSPYKKFTGLTPGTRYKIYCELWNATTNTALGVTDSVYIYTEGSGAYTLTIEYIDGMNSSTATSSKGGTLTVKSTGLTNPAGFTFLGWATVVKTKDVDYTGGEKLSAKGSDETITLYAVYSKTDTITFYFGENQESSNTRTRVQYRWNTGKKSYSKSNYVMTPSSFPRFSSSTLTVGVLTYTAIGWCEDEEARDYDYEAGHTPSNNEIGSLYNSMYAVYSRTVTISYNKNGGSGTMSDSTGTAYYNTSGNSSAATITLKSCTFTPPTGKEFSYWALGSASGTKYTSSISTSYDNTMYAVWKGSGPDAWAWSGVVTFNGKDHSCPITSGGSVPVVKQSDGTYWAFYLNASEWNEFCTQINKLRNYHGLSNYSFTSATAGYEMKASQFNQAANALNGIQSGIVSTVTAGYAIRASDIKALATAFNNLR